MSNDMLGTLVRKLVTLPSEMLGSLCDLLQKLEDETWRSAFKRFLRKEPCWVPVKPSRRLRVAMYSTAVNREWRAFYAKYFPELEVDFSRVVIPQRDGFDRTIIVAEGLTLNRLFEVCLSKFPSWRSHDDLDKTVPTNDRTPANGSYAIACCERVEADEELANLSARDLEGNGIKTMTLLERMLYELKYFDECGGHHDRKNLTLCVGSRRADGSVPSARWDGKFYVSAHYFSVDSRNPHLRAREVREVEV